MLGLLQPTASQATMLLVMSFYAGLGLGALFGMLSGIVLLVELNYLVNHPKAVWRTVASVIGSITAIPTIWFGGDALSTRSADLAHVPPEYILGVLLVFAPVAIGPMIAYEIAIIRRIR